MPFDTLLFMFSGFRIIYSRLTHHFLTCSLIIIRTEEMYGRWPANIFPPEACRDPTKGLHLNQLMLDNSIGEICHQHIPYTPPQSQEKTFRFSFRLMSMYDLLLDLHLSSSLDNISHYAV